MQNQLKTIETKYKIELCGNGGGRGVLVDRMCELEKRLASSPNSNKQNTDPSPRISLLQHR